MKALGLLELTDTKCAYDGALYKVYISSEYAIIESDDLSGAFVQVEMELRSIPPQKNSSISLTWLRNHYALIHKRRVLGI